MRVGEHEVKFAKQFQNNASSPAARKCLSLVNTLDIPKRRMMAIETWSTIPGLKKKVMVDVRYGAQPHYVLQIENVRPGWRRCRQDRS